MGSFSVSKEISIGLRALGFYEQGLVRFRLGFRVQVVYSQQHGPLKF